jgi:hypothetical protein
MQASIHRSPKARRQAVIAAGLSAVALALAAPSAGADSLGDVFVIAMENHNWAQPGSVTTPCRSTATPPPLTPTAW